MAVVGAGYTGLSAALTLARHGASVAVLERHRAGWGASGRNGGFVLPGYKPGTEQLLRRHGVDRTRALLAASLEAVEQLEALIAGEAIDCGYARQGWISLAAQPGHLRDLERDAVALRQHFGHETVVLGPGELRQEIGSARYHGGLLEPFAGALHPGRYCAGLATASSGSGASVSAMPRSTRSRRQPAGSPNKRALAGFRGSAKIASPRCWVESSTSERS